LRVLEIRLDVAESSLRQSLFVIHRNNDLVDEAERLDVQLSEISGSKALSVNQAVSLLSLFQRASSTVGDQLGMVTSISVFPEEYSTAQARTELEKFVTSLQAQTDEHVALVADLEAQITGLNEKIAGIQGEIALYTRQRDLAIDDIAIMQAQLIEAQNLIEQGRQVAEVLTSAKVSSQPISPKTMANTALAPVIVFFLSIFIIYIIEWWRKP